MISHSEPVYLAVRPSDYAHFKVTKGFTVRRKPWVLYLETLYPLPSA